MSETPLLDGVRIASPCDASWAAMRGDERARRCATCRMTVYNLSDMTRPEAEAFLASRVGRRTCAHLFRRRDGTILTRDCPRGLRDRAARLQMRAGVLLASVLLLGAADAARGGPTATAVVPMAGAAVQRVAALPGVSRLLRTIAPAPFLGDTADGEIDIVDPNL